MKTIPIMQTIIIRYIHANFLLLKSQLSTGVSKMIKCVKKRTAVSMSGSGVSVIDAPLWISVMQTWPVNSPADTNVCRRVNDEFHGMLIIFFFVSIWHPLSQSVWLAQSLWTTSLVTWTPTMCKINLCSWHQNCFLKKCEILTSVKKRSI